MYKTFDYLCPNCKHAEEIFSKDHESEKPCTNCQTAMQKMLSMPTFILKGVGCYSNGTYAKAKDGPKLDQDLLKLSDRDLNIACGLPPDCT